jgi:quinol-cytochrome oxidoreductase complex cytochrome b subunit
VTANLVGQVPLVGGWLATFFRGGTEVSGGTLVRLFALHALVFPWLAFGCILLARRLRREGGLR